MTGRVAVRRLVELIILLAMTAVYIGVSVARARGLFAMARDHRMPRASATVPARRGTPIGGKTVVVGVYAGWVLLSPVWAGLFAVPGLPHHVPHKLEKVYRGSHSRAARGDAIMPSRGVDR